MSEKRHIVDRATIDYYVRKAHAERANAFASAFAALGRQIKGIFSSPESVASPGRLAPRA